MVFRCQQDSFLRECSGRVVSCEAVRQPVLEYGRSTPFSGYAVVLDDTILFPAGGGQPHDLGWLDEERVVQVLRRGHEALHYVEKPIEVGRAVRQRIDWERRFDHMQQHTGQHLLSAILEKERELPTTSWWLGADESHVELDSASVSDEVIHAVEQRCNELIRQAITVSVKFLKSDDPALDEAHTRGLPKDCIETIRVICIGEFDENMCCGTHVSNLSQLQCLKLLGAEPGKKGKTNLRFLVGGRVLETLQRALRRERALTVLLKNDPTRHEDLVQKLQKGLKTTNKSLQNALSDLAEHEVDKFKRASPRPGHLFLCRKEATPEFCRAVCRALEGEGAFLFLAAEDPEKPKEGQIIIQGPEEHCAALGSQITELLKGKGAFKNGKYQGKAGDMTAIPKCKKLVEEYFASL